MSYRPITDVWILARPKVKYYGAYPSGFLERARVLLGVTLDQTVLHVCGGRARDYPYKNAYGPNDQTLDADVALRPDLVADVRAPFPVLWHGSYFAVIVDPPYTPEDAAHYHPGAAVFPEPNALLRNCLHLVPIGGRVGFLHYVWPQPPKTARSIACVGVICGFNNRMRVYSVFERTA